MANLILWIGVFDRLAAADFRRSRVFRDRNNPFDVSDYTFISTYRLSKYAAMHVIDVLRPFLQSNSNVSTALTPELKYFM